MTERERLGKLILTTPKKDIIYLGRKCGRAYQTAEDIADHLIANGVIVPPCKVGDTLYSIQGFDGKPEQGEPYQVTDITIYENSIVIHVTDTWLFTRNVYAEDFSKTILFTREEAEKAFKECEE